MYTLYYTIHLDGKDCDFSMDGKDIKRLWWAYDALKYDHPNTYIRVTQVSKTEEGKETMFWK